MENTEAAFDNIMESIGYYDKFQKRFSIMYNFIFNIFCCMPYMSLVLILAVPDHWCHIPGRENTSYSLLEWKDRHLPKEKNSWGEISHSSCKMYNVTSINFEFDKNTTDQVSCQNGYDYDDTWYTNTIPSTYNWVCDKDIYISNIYMVATAGEVVGAFILGQLGDYIGRRPIYLVAIILSVSGKVIGLFAGSFIYVFLFSCFVTNFPSLTALQSTLAISMEITHPDKRAHLAQVQNYGWCLSMVMLSLICWAFPSWFLFTIITTVPLAAYIFTYRSLIESPRWLAGRGRLDECVKELKKIAKENGKELQMDMIRRLRETTKEPEVVYGIMSTVSSWRMAKNTVVLTFALIVYTICYGIFILNTTNLAGNPFLQFLYQSVIELPGYVVGKYLCDKIGRRYTGSIFYVGSTIMFIPVIIMITYKSGMNLLNIFILSAKFCLSVSYYTQTLQTMEIYPTCLRQTGMSLGIVISGIFGLVSPYIIYIGTTHDARYPYIIIGILCFIAAVIQLLLPETLHVKLPETLHEAKNFGRDQKFFSTPWKQHKKEIDYELEETKFISK